MSSYTYTQPYEFRIAAYFGSVHKRTLFKRSHPDLGLGYRGWDCLESATYF